MILSRSEVSAVLQKAARGQGMPLGHIDDFVPAAIRALATNPDAASDVERALVGPHVCPAFNDNTLENARVAMAVPLAIDALRCGVVEVNLLDSDAPSLVECYLNIANEMSELSAEAEVIEQRVILRQSAEVETVTQTHGPLEVSQVHWTKWSTWAADTYVPATNESRLSGAGAGLTDND